MRAKVGTRKAAVITQVLAKSEPGKTYPHGYQPYRVEPAFNEGLFEDIAFDFVCKRTYEPGAVLIFEFKEDPYHPHAHDWQPVEEDVP